MTELKGERMGRDGTSDCDDRRAGDDRLSRDGARERHGRRAAVEGGREDTGNRALVELISGVYAAPALSAHRRAELDAELYARLEHGRRWRWLVAPGLGAALAAGLVVLLLASQRFERSGRDDLGGPRLASRNGSAAAVTFTGTASPASRAATIESKTAVGSAATAGDVAAAGAVTDGERGRQVAAPMIASDSASAEAAHDARPAQINAAAAWEYALLFSSSAGSGTEEADDELALPADYRAIAELFMAG